MRRINIYIKHIAEIASIIFGNPIASDPHILPKSFEKLGGPILCCF